MKHLIVVIFLAMAMPLTAQITTESESSASIHAMKIATIFRTPARLEDGNYDHENPGYQELLLQYFITTDGQTSKLGIVIPVPSEATVSVKSEAKMDGIALYHEETYQLAEEHWQRRTRWILSGKEQSSHSRPKPLTPKGDSKSIGTVRSISVSSTGITALGAIREFFNKEGITAPSEEPLRWHLKNDWKFVCIAVIGSGKLAKQIALPPVHLSLATHVAYLPTFNLTENKDTEFEVALISDNAIREQGLDGARAMFGEQMKGRVILRNLWRRNDLPESITSEFTDKACKDKHDRWLVNLVRGKGYVQRNDFVHNYGIAGGIVTDEIPGFWYHGDDEPGMFESFFRQHALAMMMTIAGLFLFVIISKIVKDARSKKAAKSSI